MVGVLDRALAFVDALRDEASQAVEAGAPMRPLDQLKAVTRWAMQTQLEGEMPSLPAQNSNLSASLQSNDAYMDRLIALSNRLSIWITEAQTSGRLHAALPPNWCCIPCSHGLAILSWPCSRNRGSTRMRRSSTG